MTAFGRLFGLGRGWAMIGGVPVRFLCALAVVVVFGLSCSASAFAGPVWSVSSAHGPQSFEPGGEGEYAITAFNTAFNTTNNPVNPTSNAIVGQYTVVDTLPAGVEATGAHGAVESGWNCSGTAFPATVVTCNNEEALRNGKEETLPARSGSSGLSFFSIRQRGAAPALFIDVKVAGNAPVGTTANNEVTVSGGGAASVSTSDPTTFGATQPGFGLVGDAFQWGSFDSVFPAGNSVSQAGAHPFELRYDMAFNLRYNDEGAAIGATEPFTEPDQHERTIATKLPLGLLGDPQAAARCTSLQFNTLPLAPTGGFTSCPAAAQVGTISVLLNNVESLVGTYEAPNVTTDIPLYNMVPPKGAVADFGFAVQSIPVHITVSLDPSDHYAIVATAANVTQVFPIRSAKVTLWGVPADPAHDKLRFHPSLTNNPFDTYYGTPANVQQVPFLTLPSQCDTATQASVRLTSWQQELGTPPVSVAGPSQTATGCENQRFSASVKAQPTSSEAGAPTGLSLDVSVPQDLNNPGLGTPPVKKVSLSFPEGMTLSPSAADGLQACTPSEIGLGTNNPVGCPEASKIGEVEVKTPDLEETIGGSVYVAAQNDNPFKSLIALYMVLEDKERGLLIKLPGEGKLDPNTGRLTTTFDENPQFPFSDLHLELKSGPRAPLMNPAACGTYATMAAFTSWNSSLPVVNSSDPFTLTSNCTLGFAPSFTAGTISNAAGSFSPFVLSFSRTDADQQISGLTDTFPPGASAVIKGVTQCSQAQVTAAENGTGGCPEASRIGSVTVGSGPGSDPYFLKGSVYLTGPYNGGPFGEAVVVPAVAGPYNLGNVVVRGSIRIDAKTAQPSVVSDPFPRFVKSTGIPTDVRRVDVTLDRQKFTFNPTSCKELQATAALTSTQGATANLSSRFEAAECRDLRFHPSFRATTVAKTSRQTGASLHVSISYPKGAFGGQANIARVKVALPKQLPSKLTTLQRACRHQVFEVNPAACPGESRVGYAVVRTPLLGAPLTGPAYFVSHGGEEFPNLVMVLQGEGVTVELVGDTFIKKGVTTSTFKGTPDVPFERFELTLPQGKFPALGANGNLCAGRLVMPTTITGQNGAVIKQNTVIKVTGCPRHGAHVRHGRK